jgi:hypothetical protein
MTENKVDERRREKRVAITDRGRLRALNPVSSESWSVTIVDTSAEGFQIKSPKPMLPGTLVQIRTKNMLWVGEIRYCTAMDTGFALGIRIESSLPIH